MMSMKQLVRMLAKARRRARRTGRYVTHSGKPVDPLAAWSRSGGGAPPWYLRAEDAKNIFWATRARWSIDYAYPLAVTYLDYVP
jgi:hypothetical protein